MQFISTWHDCVKRKNIFPNGLVSLQFMFCDIFFDVYFFINIYECSLVTNDIELLNIVSLSPSPPPLSLLVSSCFYIGQRYFQFPRENDGTGYIWIRKASKERLHRLGLAEDPRCSCPLGVLRLRNTSSMSAQSITASETDFGNVHL